MHIVNIHEAKARLSELAVAHLEELSRLGPRLASLWKGLEP